MNSFSISACYYDGSSGGGNQNPLCWIKGTVNGEFVFPSAYFAYLQAAIAANQVQPALTALALMYNYYISIYFEPGTPLGLPQFPAVNVSPVRVMGPYPQPSVSITQALIPNWTA